VAYIAAMVDPRKYPDYMEIALREAQQAFEEGEVPVGALVVLDGKVIGRGHNRTESLHDATAHAEMIALTAAYEHGGDWRLDNCFLFCTLEPCPMCAGAALLSRIHTIVFGARDPKFGGCGSIVDIPQSEKFNHHIEVISGVLADEVAPLMKRFFARIRNRPEWGTDAD
jgi:tRNA(adenine34) deaminase